MCLIDLIRQFLINYEPYNHNIKNNQRTFENLDLELNAIYKSLESTITDPRQTNPRGANTRHDYHKRSQTVEITNASYVLCLSCLSV